METEETEMVVGSSMVPFYEEKRVVLGMKMVEDNKFGHGGVGTLGFGELEERENGGKVEKTSLYEWSKIGDKIGGVQSWPRKRKWRLMIGWWIPWNVVEHLLILAKG